MDNVTFDRYDTADYLETEAYLEAITEEAGDNSAYIARALEAVARARKTISVAP
jgi:DNA-binding phage protein